MSKLFDKKIVAITGAAGGIGQELSRHFGREGAIIFAIDKKIRLIPSLLNLQLKELLPTHLLVILVMQVQLH